jgi:hypothetical protein
MLNQIAADFLVFLHFLFILFVVFGGLLLFKWKWIAWFHVPAAVWGALIEFIGWICPLTPLENKLRIAAGGEAYSVSFIEQYIAPIVYPSGLTRNLQVELGIGVVVINVAIYAAFFLKRSRQT